MEKPALTTAEGLRLALEELGLNTKGQKAELKLRLRKAKKKLKESEEKKLKETEENKKLKESQEITQPYDYYLFFDVEATCIENGGFNYANEIIEFPVVLVDGKTFDIVSTDNSILIHLIC
ncbi:hypothetical protein G6F56_010823 [Rhizopus delemar]|nr:hypothetical protein G6F56_010823 [Rhizopus delemar]